MHIIRSHGGIGVPIGITSKLSSNQNVGNGLINANRYDSLRHYPIGHGETAEPSPKKDPFHETLEDLLRFKELVGNFSLMPHNIGFLPYQAPLQTSGKTLPTSPFGITISPEANPIRDFIVGFKAYMCIKCFTIDPLPILAIAETWLCGIHTCNERKISETKGLAVPDRKKRIENVFARYPQETIKAIRMWWVAEANPHLHSIRLIKAPRNEIDTTKLVLNSEHWFHRTLSRTEAVLNEAELREFLSLTFGNTFCAVRANYGPGNQKEIEDYFLVLCRDSKLPSLLSTPHQDWLSTFENYMENGWAGVANGLAKS